MKKGNSDIIRALLAAGVNRNSRQNSYQRPSALHNAIAGKLPEITAILLEGRVNPDIRDRYDRTPLHFAARQNDLESARMLVTAGAKTDVADTDGKTPLTLAAEKRSEALARLLLDAGAKPDFVRGKTATALRIAAGNGDIAMVRVLLAAGADPTVKDDMDRPLIDIATDAAVIRLLEEAGAKRGK